MASPGWFTFTIGGDDSLETLTGVLSVTGVPVSTLGVFTTSGGGVGCSTTTVVGLLSTGTGVGSSALAVNGARHSPARTIATRKRAAFIVLVPPSGRNYRVEYSSR
jgi:hypothetical protein